MADGITTDGQHQAQRSADCAAACEKRTYPEKCVGWLCAWLVCGVWSEGQGQKPTYGSARKGGRRVHVIKLSAGCTKKVYA